MATDRTAWLVVPAAAAMLLWPALWNGYPIVFADTGTYLSQAIHHYAGWDRPVFYSLFMLPLHATITVWPVVVVQALLAAWVLWLVCRVLRPDMTGLAFVGLTAVLAVVTWLPWIVSELMPDIFTPLLILLICLLALAPQHLSPREQMGCVGLAAFMIASQQSSVPLACVLLGVLALFARYYSGPIRWRLLIVPPVLAVLALCSVNLLAHGRFAISPFGNVFLLARVIYDGPGMAALRHDCPAAGWRLCPYIDDFPETSDDFLWTPASPLIRAGGSKRVSQDADAIIRAALAADPVAEVRAVLSNTGQQLAMFASGDGLNPWPAQVSAWVERDFPRREVAAYDHARQQAGSLAVPLIIADLHVAAALAGVLACAILLPVALARRAPCAGYLLAVLVALPLSAAITGALSSPHDRYQSRIMWLPPFVATLSLLSLLSLKKLPLARTPTEVEIAGIRGPSVATGRRTMDLKYRLERSC
jgi:hypothetical protein